MSLNSKIQSDCRSHSYCGAYRVWLIWKSRLGLDQKSGWHFEIWDLRNPYFNFFSQVKVVYIKGSNLDFRAQLKAGLRIWNHIQNQRPMKSLFRYLSDFLLHVNFALFIQIWGLHRGLDHKSGTTFEISDPENPYLYSWIFQTKFNYAYLLKFEGLRWG